MDPSAARVRKESPLVRRTLAVLTLLSLLLAGCGDNGGGGDKTPNPLQTIVAGKGATGTFTSGVASGDVTKDTVVLWTRAEGGDFVLAEIAKDADFTQVARQVSTTTSAAFDFRVKVRAGGLEPDTQYHYRFRSGSAVSPTGIFLTAPDETTSQAVRFVFSGDSDGTRKPDGSAPYNEFDVLNAAAAEDPAFFLYFGDTIYADRAPEATTLDGYRAKYRENRGYKALTDILAKTAAYTMWDDHEVVNDFAGATVDREMFAAGQQAFFEYMPIDEIEGREKMYRAFRWGKDIDLIVLDQRSFRSASAADACLVDGNPDPVPGAGAAGAPDTARAVRGFVGLPADVAPACAAALDDPARTLLGAEQKEFLKRRLQNSSATWKVIVNETPAQALLALPYDRWEGYAAERREMLEFIRDNGIKNVVFLTTDFHANIFGPVRIDPFGEEPPVAYEAIAGPIATTPLQQDIEKILGGGAAGLFDEFLTGIVGVDCAQLDAYAYGLVETDPAAGTLTITAKDEDGTELCKKELQAE